jgi:putative transposase
LSRYRRNYVQGGTYFFTVVTFHRRPILTEPECRKFLHESISAVRAKRPFRIEAFVLLPEHLHCIWTLPPGDDHYSLRWRQIKEAFTRTYLGEGGEELPQSRSRIEHGQRGVWQKRFWEHTCWDDDDLKRCIDYIHWNPVKHRLVQHVKDWPWSSFHRYVKLGEYLENWGEGDPTPGYNDPEWE